MGDRVLELPDLKAVYRRQWAANDLMLTLTLGWRAECSSCSVGEWVTGHPGGMVVAHALMDQGWTTRGRSALCPKCSDLQKRAEAEELI